MKQALSLTLFFLAGGLSLGAPAISSSLQFTVLGRYETGAFDEGAAEIGAYDPASQQLFVTNALANTVDVLDISDPTQPVLVSTIDLSPFGGGVNSVDLSAGALAIAVEAAVKQDPGTVAFFDTSGNFLSAVTVGALPDMVTFTPDGNTVLVANEGEPNDSYTVDPEGSVSVIDVSGGAANVAQSDVRTADFQAFNGAKLDSSVRVYGPGATAAQDFEPEFIAVSPDSATAWVTLQENNAIAIVDVAQAVVVDVVGLGTKNHRIPANAFDASNEDGGINITTWPVQGLYLPDSIATLRDQDASTLLITANEGDSRDYSGFGEETRVGDVLLDPDRFPSAFDLQQDENLGRLKITTTQGDKDGDGDYDVLYSFGARSFSVWTANGHLVYDSGSTLEEITAAALPGEFNSSNDENNSFDDRSDDKGPEPEGLALGSIDGVPYLFVGLERIGGVAAFDMSLPRNPVAAGYVNTRDFQGDPLAGTAGDLGPEGLEFVSAADSPNGAPLLIVTNEVSGSTVIFEVSTTN